MDDGVHSAAGPLSVSALLQLCPDDKQPDGDGGFFSLRFGAEHGVVSMAEELQGAMVRKGAKAQIVNMAAGGDIDTTVFEGIERASTFVVFGSAGYGEDTRNQACTYYEYL